MDQDGDDDDGDSNTSDKSFKHNGEYQKRFDSEVKTSNQGLATNETQNDHFLNPIQQHNTRNEESSNNNNNSTSFNEDDDTINLGVLNHDDDNDNDGEIDTMVSSGVNDEDDNDMSNSGGRNVEESADAADIL